MTSASTDTGQLAPPAEAVVDLTSVRVGGPPRDLADLIRWATEATFLLDADGTMQYGSGTPLRVLGYGDGDLTGRRFDRVFGPTIAGPVALWSRWGVAVTYELRVSRFDGGGALIVATDGDTRRWMEAGADHDERVGLVLFRLDDRGALASISSRWEQLTGQSADEARGVGWLRCVHKDDRRVLRRVAGQAHERGEGWTAEVRVRTGEGAWQRVLAALAPQDTGAVGVLAPDRRTIASELNETVRILSSNLSEQG